MSDDLMISTDKGPDMGLVSDHRNLRKLRELGQGDKKSQALALKAAAEQFQSILNQYWVDAMRQSNDTINPDSPLHSKYSGFFEDMLAQQNVSTMTSKEGMNKNSITYLLTKQFAKSLGDEAKVSVRNIRRDYMDLLKEDDSLSDDYRERVQDDLQKETDEANKKIDEILAIKQKEILTI